MTAPVDGPSTGRQAAAVPPAGLELCVLNASGLRHAQVAFDGGRARSIYWREQACADSAAQWGVESDAELLGLYEPGYSKIRFRSELGDRGGVPTSLVFLSFTDANRKEVKLPVFDVLTSSWSIDTSLEGWGLTSVKFTWDAMTPDGRPRVTASFR